MKCCECEGAYRFNPPTQVSIALQKQIRGDFPNAFVCPKTGTLVDGDKTCNKVEVVSVRDEDGEWTSQFHVWTFKYPDGSLMEVSLNTVPCMEMIEGESMEAYKKRWKETMPDDWEVTCEGAVDYNGDIKGLLERYPELKEELGGYLPK